jgi:hypothetical protein
VSLLICYFRNKKLKINRLFFYVLNEFQINIRKRKKNNNKKRKKRRKERNYLEFFFVELVDSNKKS